MLSTLDSFITEATSIYFVSSETPFNRIKNPTSSLDGIMNLIFLDYKLNKAVAAFTEAITHNYAEIMKCVE